MGAALGSSGLPCWARKEDAPRSKAEQDAGHGRGGGRLAARGGARPAPREHVLSREAHSSMVSVGRTRCPPGRAPLSSPRRPQGWRVTPSGSGVPSRPAARARTVQLGCRRGGGDGGGEGAPGCAAGVPRSGEPMGLWHHLRGQGGRRSRGTPLAS